MITLQTDENNDLVRIPGGNVSMIRGAPAVAQTTTQFVRAILGEMLYKYDEGVPVFEVVFGANLQLYQFEAAMRQRILESPQVTAIRDFEATQDGDVLRYTATIETIDGLTTING